MKSEEIIAKLKQYPIALGGAVVSLLLVVVLYFTSGTIDTLNQQYEQLESRIETIKSNERNSFGLSEQVETAQTILEEINSRLMIDEAKAEHYAYFLGLAEASDVNIQDPRYDAFYNPGEKGVKISTSEFAQIGYALQINGLYKNVFDFLYRLRTGQHFVTTRSLSLTKDHSLNGSLIAEIQVRVLAEKIDSKKKK